MIITFHMHFISVHAFLDQFPCLYLFDNDKGGENVYELIVTMFLCFSFVDVGYYGFKVLWILWLL